MGLSVDVTEPDAEVRELQRVLKGGAVPKVDVSRAGGELAAVPVQRRCTRPDG